MHCTNRSFTAVQIRWLDQWSSICTIHHDARILPDTEVKSFRDGGGKRGPEEMAKKGTDPESDGDLTNEPSIANGQSPPARQRFISTCARADSKALISELAASIVGYVLCRHYWWADTQIGQLGQSAIDDLTAATYASGDGVNMFLALSSMPHYISAYFLTCISF